MRLGADKYEEGNWQKGQPTKVALQSLHRHLAKFEYNLKHGIEQDEDHISACIFNLMLIFLNDEKDNIPVDFFYNKLKDGI